MDRTTETLERHITSLREHDPGPRAMREATRHLIDSLGCALGAFESEPACARRGRCAR